MYKNLKENYPLYEVREISSFRDLLDSGATIYGDRAAFKYKVDGEVVSVSYKEFKGAVDAFGTALIDMGISGKHIGIVGDNCFEWVRSYLAILASDSVVVPVDKELSAEDIKNILTDGDCEVLIYSDGATESKITEIEADLPNITHFICMSVPSVKDDKHYFAGDIVSKGKELLDGGDTRYISLVPDNQVLKELLFTSGTTGKSKGVMLSAEALIFNIINGQKLMKITDTCLSVLPYHHSYESTTGILVMMHAGMTICINESLRSVLPNFKLYKPTEVLLVPLFVEKVYRGIWDKAEASGKASTLRKLIKVSNALLKIGIDVRAKLFVSVTSAFGGRLKAIVCGGAPLKPQLVEFFESIGITLINGYGISECGPLISINRPCYRNSEAVGILLPEMEIKINNPNENGEGEICVKGRNVMLGYYKNEQATADAIRDGWFHTGDVGKLEGDFIFITGRIKNIIILKNGKNIYPEEIEEKLSIRSELIAEIVVKAIKDNEENERLLGAEIFPDFERAKTLGIDDPESEIRKVISEYNEKEAGYKVIKKIIFRTEEFEKTTTRKIKRKYN
ncbi:MAG: AMP-dependent synthetase [Firmicutes bacterium HGW-Firmicutes-21]|nr:MAG: AMP-dependent synthetase [Firmicutes bacterium HGW-Firmicutes-21]